MKTSKLIALAAFAAISMSASAQFANTPGKGGGSAGIHIENDCNPYSRVSFGYMGVGFTVKADGGSYSSDDMDMNGFTLGYTRGLSLSSSLPVFVEVGGQMNYATHSKDSFRTNFLALSVPVSLTYKLNFNNGLYLAPYAGIHFDLGLIFKGKIKEGGESYSFSYYSSDDMDDENYNRFQMGYQVGANVGYQQFNFGVGYKASFLPIYKEGDVKLQTGGVVVTLGYNF